MLPPVIGSLGAPSASSYEPRASAGLHHIELAATSQPGGLVGVRSTSVTGINLCSQRRLERAKMYGPAARCKMDLRERRACGSTATAAFCSSIVPQMSDMCEILHVAVRF